MAAAFDRSTDKRKESQLDPFRRAVLRGLGILLPPLLTIVIFLWIGNTVAVRLLEPLENMARKGFLAAADIREAPELRANEFGEVTLIDDDVYCETGDGKFVPQIVFDKVREARGDEMPTAARAIYTEYINREWLRRDYVIPVFLSLFILVLYLLGRFLAAGAGRFPSGSIRTPTLS